MDNRGIFLNFLIILLLLVVSIGGIYIYEKKDELFINSNFRVLDEDQVKKFDDVNFREVPDGIKKVEYDIDSFKECVDAGYPVMESYPRRCNDGVQTYVEETELLGIRIYEPQKDSMVKLPLVIKGELISEDWRTFENNIAGARIIDSEGREITDWFNIRPEDEKVYTDPKPFNIVGLLDNQKWIGEMLTQDATLIFQEIIPSGSEAVGLSKFSINIKFPEEYLQPKIDSSIWNTVSNDGFMISYKYPKDWNIFNNNLSGTQAIIGIIESNNYFNGKPRYEIEIKAYDGTRYDSFDDLIITNTNVIDGLKPSTSKDFNKEYFNSYPVFSLKTKDVEEDQYHFFLADPRNDVVYRFILSLRNIPDIDIYDEYGYKVMREILRTFTFR